MGEKQRFQLVNPSCKIFFTAIVGSFGDRYQFPYMYRFNSKKDDEKVSINTTNLGSTVSVVALFVDCDELIVSSETNRAVEDLDTQNLFLGELQTLIMVPFN